VALSSGPWISVALLGNTYSMSEFNDVVQSANQLLVPGVPSMEKIDRSLGVSVMIGISNRHGTAIGLTYDHLSANTGISFQGENLSIDLPADLLGAFASHRLASGPQSALAARLRAGLLLVNGQFTYYAAGFGTDRLAIDGSAPVLQFELVAEHALGPNVALSASGGYRRAIVENSTIDGVEWWNLDYSGVAAGIAIVLYVARR